MIDKDLKQKLTSIAKKKGRITVLTGAGISAESGIPTFRGPEGYWTIGSQEYHPQDMATFAMFQRKPDAVWLWYLYRRGVCRRAEPNAGHLALVELESRLGNNFALITQNVDGLHLRAGNTLARTYQIHGNVDYMRCVDSCSAEVYPIPEAIPAKTKKDVLSETERKLLRCSRCGGLTRPHVLWFDEYYNEDYYKFQSSLAVAAQTDLLIVVGSSGTTNLPLQVAFAVHDKGDLIIDVNIQASIFTELAESSGGYFMQQPSGKALPALVKTLISVD